MIGGLFFGLKFLIRGFFWVGKLGKYFFGWLDLSRDCLGIQNNLSIRGQNRDLDKHDFFMQTQHSCISVSGPLQSYGPLRPYTNRSPVLHFDLNFQYFSYGIKSDIVQTTTETLKTLERPLTLKNARKEYKFGTKIIYRERERKCFYFSCYII